MQHSGMNLASGLRPQLGKEVFEVTPVILGGDPIDPANKVLLNREQHIKAVAYWNRVIRNLRDQQAGLNPSPGNKREQEPNVEE